MLMAAVQELREAVNKLRGQQIKTQRELKAARAAYVVAARGLALSKEAQLIVTRIAAETQRQIKVLVTDVGTKALQASLGTGWELDLDFVERAGRTEAPLQFLRGPNRIPTNPIEADSGGACYISALGLRCSSLRMATPQLRPVLFLDEPAKDLNDPSRKAHERFAEMIRQISDSGIQFLIVTGVQEIKDVADKVFTTNSF